nr:MAG TPA: hypothetical protein [Bacteriophage sp.]
MSYFITSCIIAFNQGGSKMLHSKRKRLHQLNVIFLPTNRSIYV